MGDRQSSDRSAVRHARPAQSFARMPTASGAILRLAAAQVRSAGKDVAALLNAE